MGLVEIEKGSLRFMVREGTLDEWVVNEVCTPREYLKPMKIRYGDRILDIGMNIGSFSVLASYVGAQTVGYEPDLDNYTLACKNLELNGFKRKTHNAGVSDVDKEVLLYVCDKKNKGTHTTTPTKGRPAVKISCEGINDILARENPNKIKMDCEGEEYPIIMGVTDWRKVKLIRLEWHRKILKDESNSKLEQVWEKLLADGFRIRGKRDGRGWVSMLTAERK